MRFYFYFTACGDAFCLLVSTSVNWLQGLVRYKHLTFVIMSNYKLVVGKATLDRAGFGRWLCLSVCLCMCVSVCQTFQFHHPICLNLKTSSKRSFATRGHSGLVLSSNTDLMARAQYVQSPLLSRKGWYFSSKSRAPSRGTSSLNQVAYKGV